MIALNFNKWISVLQNICSLDRILKQHVTKIIARIFITLQAIFGPVTKLLTDLNRNIAQVQSSGWNYHYSAGTASVVLEIPSLKLLHFLSHEERLVNIFIQERLKRAQFIIIIVKCFHC